MNIKVKVKPNSTKSQVVYNEVEDFYLVSVKSSPESGKANDETTKLLAKYFDLPITSISLMSGGKSRYKIFNIEQ